jgi:hypothetical protein
MPDIEVTDQLDKPIPSIQVDLTHPSSLLKYLKTQLLHLTVLDDFLQRKDKLISQAATTAVEFSGTIQHEVEIGNTQPEIEVTPQAKVTIRVNASPGTNLFAMDPFHVPAQVPPSTGYVSVGFTGTLDLGGKGKQGDLSFGFNEHTTIALEYFKAFPLGQGEPTVGDALGRTLSSYVIPADVSDLNLLGVYDIATVSGQGSLKVSGKLSISGVPNPLASVGLPFGAGALAVSAGPSAACKASFEIAGSYEIRVWRSSADKIQLSVSPERGTTLKADFSASVGVSVSVGDTDLLSFFLDLISANPAKDRAALAGLNPSELAVLTGAIKDGLDHSVQASIDVELSTLTDDQTAFQYEIQLSKLSPEASLAVHRALDGDLSLLTAMEDKMQRGGVLAPGIRLLNSVWSRTRQRGSALKVNLLGIVNLLSVSELIRNGEVLFDASSGDITIKETVTGNRISAIVNPLDRGEALRKAIFDSVLVTTSYRASKVIELPELNCEQVHFATNQNTNRQTMRDYLNWFSALRLLMEQEEEAILRNFSRSGRSVCVLRTQFNDAACRTMFFKPDGQLRDKNDYLEIGRLALRALLDPEDNPNDQLRNRIVDDALWPTALETGADVSLGPLVGLSTSDPRVGFLIGDVLLIKSWAAGMAETGAVIDDLRRFVSNADPGTLIENNQFKSKREALQKRLAAMIQSSKMRFAEPWGMVSLYWAAGSPQSAYGKLTYSNRTLERGVQPATVAFAMS